MDEQSSTTTPANGIERRPDGTWIKAPRGRPRGTGEVDKIRQQLEPHKQAVLDKLAELAVAGDGKAQDTFLRYFSPGARQDEERVQVEGFATASTLQEKASAVMVAISAGQVSAAAGQRLLQSLELYTRVITAGDLERRLMALERGAPKPVVIDNNTGAVLPDNSDLA